MTLSHAEIVILACLSSGVLSFLWGFQSGHERGIHVGAVEVLRLLRSKHEVEQDEAEQDEHEPFSEAEHDFYFPKFERISAYDERLNGERIDKIGRGER